MKDKFISTIDGEEIVFHIGQKVHCSSYHEFSRFLTKDYYKRTFIESILDSPFKPSKNGTIVGDKGIHPYRDRQEQYLLVKFREYRFAKPIPISCIEDALESAEWLDKFLKEHSHLTGQKGYETEVMSSLSKIVEESRGYCDNN